MVKLPSSIIKKYGISKKAWSVFRGSQSSRKARHSKGGKTSMARRRTRRYFSRARRSRGFSVSTAFKYIRLGSLVAPGIAEVASYYQGQPIIDQIAGGIGIYGGWNQAAKRFQWEKAVGAWSPFLVATLMTKGISKIGGIFKSL